MQRERNMFGRENTHKNFISSDFWITFHGSWLSRKMKKPVLVDSSMLDNIFKDLIVEILVYLKYLHSESQTFTRAGRPLGRLAPRRIVPF